MIQVKTLKKEIIALCHPKIPIITLVAVAFGVEDGETVYHYFQEFQQALLQDRQIILNKWLHFNMKRIM